VNEMGCNQADKFTRRDDLGVLPECWKVLTIAGDQKVGTRHVGALDKDVVVGIARHLDSARRGNQVAMVLDELKQLQPKPFPDGQFRTGQYIRIFFEYGRGNV